jgi:hypothetical protein
MIKIIAEYIDRPAKVEAIPEVTGKVSMKVFYSDYPSITPGEEHVLASQVKQAAKATNSTFTKLGFAAFQITDLDGSQIKEFFKAYDAAVYPSDCDWAPDDNQWSMGFDIFQTDTVL